MEDGEEVSIETAADAEQMLIECARYGELDDMETLWQEFGKDMNIDAKDSQGSSALHMAAANGHGKIVAWLLQKDAKCFANDSGSSPLHWALMNKRADVAKLLLRCAKGVDVLDKDGVGKTAVIHAYDLNDTQVLDAVLAHPTANRLNKDGTVAPHGQQSDLEKEEETGAENGGAVVEQSKVSTIRIGDHNIEVREIGFMQGSTTSNLDANEDDLGTTGAFLWAAALILAQWINDQLRDQLAKKKVVELGAGCGLPSLATYFCTNAASVAMTDIKSPTFANTCWNAEKNSAENKPLSVYALDWCNRETWPDQLVGSTDVVIGSDLVYDDQLVQPLVDVICALLPQDGKGCFFYVSANTDRAGRETFLHALELKGFSKESFAAPADYCQNALLDTEDSTFALKFPELTNNTFTMYKFSRSQQK